MLSAPNIEYVLIIMSDEKKSQDVVQFQGYHTNQAYYKLVILSIIPTIAKSKARFHAVMNE